jgi:hypothetical protein
MALANFESYIVPEPNSGCWLWTGAISKAGYGSIATYKDGKTGHIYAHRQSFEMASKTSIPKGLCVLHKCDVRCCVNPDHLFLGTLADNIRDMDSKGRRVNMPSLGEKHGRAKLTNIQTDEIRDSNDSGVSLAEKYGVSTTTISKIRRKKTRIKS